MTIMEMVGMKMEITKNIMKRGKIMNIMKKIRTMNKIRIMNNKEKWIKDREDNKWT